MHGLDPDTAHGLLGRLHHLRVESDHLVHVPVLLLLDDVDGGPGLPLPDLRGESA